ncbi:MAG: hypothetical protein ACRDTD_27560, partial [Pseudonocardiaceae bacterium]
RLLPSVVSHGWTGIADRSRFHALFDWPGTQDPTAWLSVPTAIDAVGALHPAGWSGVMAANRDLALTARELLCETWGTRPPAPPEMIGALATVPLPGRLAGLSVAELTAHVRSHNIEAKFVVEGATFVRLSAQLYNCIEDYERLVDAMSVANLPRPR